MKDEQINLKIAKACGWTIIVRDGNIYCWHDERNKTLPPDDDGFRDVPNYAGDLNAMHEAEKTLSVGERLKYAAALPGHGIHLIISATASQRAEAFLRTKGLWKD